MQERIRAALNHSGFSDLPADLDEGLVAYGMDSLTLAMCMVELETVFRVRVDPLEVRLENFSTLRRIEEFLRNQGAT